MKKNVLVTILVLSVGSFLFSGTIQPSLSMRFNDIIETTADSGTIEPVLVVGFALEIQEGVKAGFDSDGSDSRIFVAFDYGTMGMGMNANGDPQFSVGASYNALSNLVVSLDYMINNLTTDGGEEGSGEASPNELRMSIGVNF